MDTIFLNSENSKTSNSNGLLLSLSDKIKLKRGDEHVISSSRSMCYIYNGKKGIYTKIMHLKYQLQRGIINLNYLRNDNLYQIFWIINIRYFKHIIKKHKPVIDNTPIKIYK